LLFELRGGRRKKEEGRRKKEEEGKRKEGHQTGR
jgi:hypothetical protein